jgi:hypothetical protein
LVKSGREQYFQAGSSEETGAGGGGCCTEAVLDIPAPIETKNAKKISFVLIHQPQN